MFLVTLSFFFFPAVLSRDQGQVERSRWARVLGRELPRELPDGLQEAHDD
jgi:hypothetical protein